MGYKEVTRMLGEIVEGLVFQPTNTMPSLKRQHQYYYNNIIQSDLGNEIREEFHLRQIRTEEILRNLLFSQDNYSSVKAEIFGIQPDWEPGQIIRKAYSLPHQDFTNTRPELNGSSRQKHNRFIRSIDFGNGSYAAMRNLDWASANWSGHRILKPGVVVTYPFTIDDWTGQEWDAERLGGTMIHVSYMSVGPMHEGRTGAQICGAVVRAWDDQSRALLEIDERLTDTTILLAHLIQAKFMSDPYEGGLPQEAS